MIKNILSFSLFLFLFACGGETQKVRPQLDQSESSEQTAKQDTQKRTQPQKEAPDSSNAQAQDRSEKEGVEMWRRPQSLEMHGAWRQGRFQWYQPVTQDQKNEESYGGRPKVEVLGKDDEIIKTIDIVDFQNLYGQFDSISFIGAHSPYKVHFKDPREAESYAIYSNIFPDRGEKVELLCRHEYHYNEGVLWIVTVGYAVEFDVIGAKTEIVGIDSLGNEIARKTIKGNSISVSFSVDNQYLAATTGGQISERVEYSHPMHFYLLDLKKDQLLYHYRASGSESIGGGILRGHAGLNIYKELDNGLKGIKNVLVIMYDKGLICSLDKNLHELFGRGTVLKYKEYIEYRSNDEPDVRYYFDIDFNCQAIK